MGLPHYTVERVLRRAGAKRVSKAAVKVFAEWMEKVTRDLATEAGKIAEHSSRKTIIEKDILLAEKRIKHAGGVFK